MTSRWLGIVGIVFCLQESFGYVPGGITGKYKSGLIDNVFFYEKWLSNTLCGYYGNDENVVRESLVPSAMVDLDGVLYTVDLYGMGSQGPNFIIKKYTSNSDGSSISSSSMHYYPWDTSNVGNTPYLDGYADDPDYFKDFFHNCLQPCIAQEMDTKRNFFAIFFRIPPPRYFGGSLAEGILYQDFSKEFTLSEIGKYHTDSESVYWFLRCRHRKQDPSYLYAMERGNYKAWRCGNCVHLDFLGNSAKDNSNVIWSHQYNGRWCDKTSLDTVREFDQFGVILCSRYIYDSGYIYSLIGKGYDVHLYQWIKDSGTPVKKLMACTGIMFLEDTRWGHSECAYDYDFFIETGENGEKILCFLSFGGGGSYSSNTKSYYWSSTYCNWNECNAALLVQSLTFPETGDFVEYTRLGGYGANSWTEGTGDWIQNVIYVTPYRRANGSYVDASDTSKSQEYRLYQNTHRMCKYISSEGNKYVIYCYCYPGKAKQLYLGYARCWINAQNKIMLGPKIEFRDSEEQWSNSFGDFTSCSRIISMDCRAGHLWITWMNEDNTRYYYFHILAKDLVGE